ncbi:MAG: SIMPL domain-containing protein [Balneola sp.]|jgi:hypothetical protein
MKRAILCFILAIGLLSSVNAQINNSYIEVIGEAKRSISPDQIFIKLILDDSELKNSVELTEKLLLENLKENELLKENNLFVLDQSSNLYERWLRRDKKINRKEYEIELRNEDEVSKLFLVLEDLEIYNARISKLDYSGEDEIKLQLLERALSNAKLKAKSLLKDSKQTVGNISLLSEDLQNILHNSSYFSNSSSVVRRALSGRVSGVSIASNTLELNFQELEYEVKIFVRFELINSADK